MANIFGDIGSAYDWTKKHVLNPVGHAVSAGAQDAANFVDNEVIHPAERAASTAVHAVGNAPQTFRNDAVAPIQRDFVKPVLNLPQTVNNDFVQPINRDFVQPVFHLPSTLNRDLVKPAFRLPSTLNRDLMPGAASVSDFLSSVPQATFKVFSPAARSVVGTGQAMSGLYDLASPGTGTNRFSKGLNNLAKGIDVTAQQQHVNPVYYHGGQAVSDVAQFALGSGELKAAARGAEELPKIGKIVTGGAKLLNRGEQAGKKATEGLRAGNFGQRVVGRTAQNVLNPKYQAANAAFTALQTGKQTSTGQKVTPGGVATNLAIGGVGFPVAGAIAHETLTPLGHALHSLPHTTRTNTLITASKGKKVLSLPVHKLESTDMTGYGDLDPAKVADYVQQLKNGKKLNPILAMMGKDGKLYTEDGKHRLVAYKQMGAKNVPVRVVTPADIKRISQGGYVSLPGRRGASSDNEPKYTPKPNPATSASEKLPDSTSNRQVSFKNSVALNNQAHAEAKIPSPSDIGRALGLSDKQMAAANVADSQRARLENPVSKKIRLEEQSQAEQLKAPQSQPTAKVTPRPEKPLQADQGEQQSGNTLKSHTQKHPDSSQNQKGRSSSGGKYTTNATKVNIAEVKPGDYEKVRSNAQLVQTMVHNHAQSVIHALRQLPKSERDSFWNSVENPKLPRSAKMQTAINRWQRLANTVHATSQALGGDTPYRVNYARHNWDLSDPAQKELYEQLLKQKVNDTNYNPENFKGLDNKPRAFDTIAEGQAAGFKLKSNNPIDDIVDYANKSKRQLKTQAVAKGMQEAEENVPLADKSETQTIGYKKSIETTKQGVKELRSLFPPPKSGNKALKGYRSFNHTAKRFLLGISQFHPININMQAAPALALRGHPIRAVRGLIDSAAALNKRYSDRIMENALKDGTMEDAGRIGTPIATGSDFATGNKVDLKAGFGERAVFERQLPAMHVQMVRGVVADLKKRGISLDSQEARKAGTEINQIMGYVNTELRNLSPTVQRGLGDVALAPQFTRSKWEVLGDAFNPKNAGTLQGKYARDAVVGKYLAEAGITLALGALLGQKSDNIKDTLIRTLIHPAVPTPFKDKKGNTIELGLPQNYLSEAAGLGLNYTRGKNGHLSISASPSGIPGNLKDYGKNRLALIPNDALKIATNTDFADKPLYNPTSSSGDKIAQTLATLGVGHLPIGLQGLAYTKAVNKHLPQNVQDVLNNASPGSNPILKSVGSSFGLNPRTDKTVGKGLSTTRYFDALDNAKKGLNSRELAAIVMNTDSKKNPVTGKYDVTPNVNDSRAKATALLDQPKAFNALYKMNQNLAKQGEKVDPLWRQSPDKVKSYLAYQAMAPGSADKSDWYSKNKSWYQPVAAARSTFFNNLPPGDPNKPQLASEFTYPAKPKAVTDYYTLKSSNPTAANAFFDNHPEIARYEDQYAQVTNNWRTAQGYAPFKNYPKASPDVQSFMDNYNAADKATRKSIRNSNPTQYREMIAYYDALDLYNINKQGALGQLQGEPDYTDKSAKAIKNIGEDFYVDQNGNYHLIPAGWMLGLGGDSGYGGDSRTPSQKLAYNTLRLQNNQKPVKYVGASTAKFSLPKFVTPPLKTVYTPAKVSFAPKVSVKRAV